MNSAKTVLNGEREFVCNRKGSYKEILIKVVLLKTNKVVVKGVNFYTKHLKPQGEKSGEKIRRERSLPLSKIAIINNKGQADRIGIKLLKNGKKERFFKKTSKPVPDNKLAESKK